jgi:hypothetical protein
VAAVGWGAVRRVERRRAEITTDPVFTGAD